MIGDLPSDVLLLIFKFFDFETLKCLCSVSRKMKNVAESPSLWKTFQLKISTANIKSLDEILQLTRFSSLQEIHFIACELSNENIRSLLRRGSVTSLVLGTGDVFERDCCVSQVDADLLGSLITRLSLLTISNWDRENKLTQDQWKTLFKHMEKDESKLSGLEIISDQCCEDDKSVPSVLAKLEYLSISDQAMLSFTKLFQQMVTETNLQRLELLFTNLSNISEELFSSALAKIKHVDISYSSIKKNQLKHLFTKPLKIERFNHKNMKDEEGTFLSNILTKCEKKEIMQRAKSYNTRLEPSWCVF